MSNDGWDSVGSTIERVLGTAVLSPILGPLAPVVGGLFGHGHAPQAPAPAPAPAPGPPPGPQGPPNPPPQGQLPPPPAGPVPGSGAATDQANAAAGRVAEVIAQLHELDKSAAATIDAIHAAGAAGQKQLDNIGKDVNDKITELGPRLNTPAGQQELRDFLKEKLTAAKKVIDQQIADAEEKARHTRELTEKYAGIGGDDSGKAGTEPAAAHGGGGSGDGGEGSGGGGGAGDQGTTPAAAPAAAAGTPPAGQPMMPGAGLMPAGMGMPSIPSLGGMPGLGGGDPLGALGGLGGDRGAGFHDEDGNLGGDSSKQGGSGPKFHDDDGSTGSGSGKADHDPTGTSPASAGGSAGDGSGAGTELAGNRAGHAGDPGAGQVPATTSVSLPDGETSEARTAQGAAAAKAALGGATVADAWHQAGVTVPPPGTPVTDPIPPTKLKAGDVGIWQDHLVMALGNGKVLVSGQPQPLSSVGSGPDFLGWMDPSALAPKGSGPAAPPAPPAAPPAPPAQPS
ncbi:DUF4226 domain-containing protein [Mycobacterium avium]|uniref:DUF4226 domain-containing protein n=1 Tax=Mycobacterium avium TaxID=1764 RepID=UPI000BAEE308|nr:DUF4226 domain-containing protein [Mycobacterium avium]MDO2394712.1 DUF4226 domain-containing protein [Mycobacterium avium subsp. hominissuis]PBA68950.1 hypothetical protein CKJ76_25560 [Mycobacterium avium]